MFGAIVGGCFTAWAVHRTHEYTMEREEANENRMITSMLKAIHDEISDTWSNYVNNVGAMLENLPTGQPFAVYFPVTHETLFLIYRNNTDKIGKINDDELRKSIVSTYAKSAALVQSFIFNNHLNGKVEYWSHLHAQTQNPVHLLNVNNHMAV